MLGMALSTVSGILTQDRDGQARAVRARARQRYERERPGELIHIDVKKLGRIQGGAGPSCSAAAPAQLRRPIAPARVAGSIGWECVHIAIDDCTRLAYAEVLADEKATTAVGFLRRAIAFYERHGITVEQLITDNGSAYQLRSCTPSRAALLGIRHLRTRPYRPQTNGKAERFIRTLLGGWAYGAIYRNSTERTAALDGWLWHYNHQRQTLSPRPQAAHRPPQRANQPSRYLHLGAGAWPDRTASRWRC